MDGVSGVSGSSGVSGADGHGSVMQPDGTQVFHSPVQKTVEIIPERLLIMDTDQGAVLAEKVDDLTDLVEAFKEGLIKEVY